ncbi:hypothetical protein GCM10010968_07570 [Agrococcus terreus]|uniref:Uncharacterized protein n=1 Tax=Agrococcus terreus TaxID=574649 RepID=A0ABQ2KFH6_9MICO|nr:hypothetical protein GCM10010968_07570 [Agrococcus terreus]
MRPERVTGWATVRAAGRAAGAMPWGSSLSGAESGPDGPARSLSDATGVRLDGSGDGRRTAALSDVVP